MSEESSGGGGNCCGCFVSLVLAILLATALGWGLQIGDSKWNIDIFPPRIWDMTEANTTEAPTSVPTPAIVPKNQW